ncbi:hypothetical protein [uncultured Clostridium sp.]|uniref:hypothetical protein n=1 Tax=uncultured Clostridium sp. TaxID=59620 RepID=UPI0028EFE7FE|nr:hypothetical protein [uncultured Clostridium sp.]
MEGLNNMMFETLRYIGEKLNHEGVKWAVGASILLNHYGLVDNPNDIDILIDLEDKEKVDNIFKDLGVGEEKGKTTTYLTRYFGEYKVNNVYVDIMGGFIINHENGQYEYIFDENSITSSMDLNGINIPLTSLEDWYVAYQLIPNRDYKVEIIENHLLKQGIKHMDLLKRASKQELPDHVKDRISKLVDSLSK